LAGPLWAGDGTSLSDLDELILNNMEQNHIPGMAACIVDKNNILWSNAYGWADLSSRKPMSIDGIQNIGSISKTFAATAIMQLWELGLVSLDRDINDYLPFPIRNPNHPDTPISIRQLMIHTSSLRDGSAYVKNYACGDPKIGLATWIREYFVPGGAFYDATENFNTWSPGTTWQYANLPYGVLGSIVEAVSGISFETYCHRNIFAPLRLQSTSWLISDLDPALHTVPYSWVENGNVRGPSWGDLAMGVVRPDGLTLDRKLEDGYQPNCLYNHPNYPDGFLRTSVNDLSRYLRTWLNEGKFEGNRILATDTVGQMFTPQALPPAEDGKRTYGLTWYSTWNYSDQPVWGHGGGDPGIGTGIYMLPDQGVGFILFINTDMAGPSKAVLNSLMEASVRLAG
jgi:CubicO group peptidase (beta-lactamase class C family)